MGLLLSLVPDLSLLGLLRGEGELTWHVRTCLCAWNIAVSLLLVVRWLLPSRALFTNLSLCRWPSVDVSFYFTATSMTIFKVISSQVGDNVKGVLAEVCLSFDSSLLLYTDRHLGSLRSSEE